MPVLSLLATLDVVTLSRAQFALTIMFHYLFPPLTIGMGVVLVWLGFRSVTTGDPIYRQAQQFWTKIFALNFAIGVATGIVMEFQFGTNWSVYSEFVGDVFGSALAAEGIFAFFLESGFLAVLVFGWNHVGPKMHFFSTCMVALGSIFSAIWIVVANSWQQTPAGHHIVPVLRNGLPWVVNGVPMMRAEIVSFWGLVFNPTSVIRLLHVLTGAFIGGGALVCSIGAWYLLHNQYLEFAKHSVNGGLIVLTIGAFTAAGTGHLHARIVYRYQPAKMAAYEGQFTSDRGDLNLFGWPDTSSGTIRGNISIPGGYSFLLKDSFKANVVGLDKFDRKDWPVVPVAFASYRFMVAFGTYLMLLTLLAMLFRWRGTLFQKRWMLWLFVITIFPALIANHAGWVATETGRQPWVVYPPVQWTGGAPGEGDVVTGPDGKFHYDETQGLRTANAVSRAVTGEQVLGSIIGFGVIYSLLFVVWLSVLNHKIHVGPEAIKVATSESEDLHGYFDAAAGRPDHEESLTEAKEAQLPGDAEVPA